MKPILRRLAPIGLPIEVTSNHPLPVALLEDLFANVAGDPIAPAPAPSGQPLRISIEVVEASALPGAELDGTSPNYEIAWPSITCRLGHSVSKGDCDTGKFSVRIAPTELERPDLLSSVLLATPVLATLSRRVAQPFHAAGLVDSSTGRGAIVRAAAGGGKSTLALAWSRAGGRVLAEETLWVTRRATMHGFATAVEVVPDAARFFSGVALEPFVTPTGEAKLRWPLVTVGSPPPRARSACVGAVVVLDRQAGSAPRLEPISADEAAFLFRSSRIAEEELFADPQGLLAGLLEVIPAFRLRTGGDPHAGAKELARELSRTI